MKKFLIFFIIIFPSYLISKENQVNREKKIIRDQKKIEKTGLIKKTPPKGYFSNIIEPSNVNDLNNKITEAINYGAKYLLIINWRADTDHFYIAQVLNGFNGTEKILDFNKVLVVNLQSQIPSLQEVVKILGFGDPAGTGKTDVSNDPFYFTPDIKAKEVKKFTDPSGQKGDDVYKKSSFDTSIKVNKNILLQLEKEKNPLIFHPGLIVCKLPLEPIPSEGSYFVENSVLNLKSAKLILPSSTILYDSKAHYKKAGDSKKDYFVLTNINLNEINKRIKESLDIYFSKNTKKKLDRRNKEKSHFKNLNNPEKKTLKKTTSDEKKINSKLKKTPPNGYFSTINTPENINSFNEKINEAINYGAQAAIIIYWQDTNNINEMEIPQIIEAFSPSENILNSYRIITFCIGSSHSDLNNFILNKFSKNLPPNLNSNNINDLTAKISPSILAFQLPKQNLKTTKILMNKADIEQGYKIDQNCDKHGKNCIIKSVTLDSQQIPQQIEQSIQSYVSSIPLYPIQYNQKAPQKLNFKSLNIKLIERLKRKSNQIKNYTNFNKDINSDQDTVNSTDTSPGFFGKVGRDLEKAAPIAIIAA